jgi:hypothetical protein
MFFLARAAEADVVLLFFRCPNSFCRRSCDICQRDGTHTHAFAEQVTYFLPRELFRSNFDVADDDDVFAVPLFGLVAHVRDDQSYLHWRAPSVCSTKNGCMVF